MRIALSIVAVGVIFLGLWLIASSSSDPKIEPGTSSPVITSQHQANPSPVVLGTALLVGGVIFFLMVLRRR